MYIVKNGECTLIHNHALFSFVGGKNSYRLLIAGSL